MLRLDNIRDTLNRKDTLSVVSRYLHNHDDFIAFLRLCRKTIVSEEGSQRLCKDFARADVEMERSQSKIRHQMMLCKSYIRQFETWIQMVRLSAHKTQNLQTSHLTSSYTISFNATQITERLDSGRTIGERLTKVGLIMAATTGFLAPLNLLTSYYGMNMKSISNDGLVTSFQFWSFGLLVTLSTLVLMFFVSVWVWTRSIRF